MNGWHWCYIKNERMMRFIQDGVAYLANPLDVPDDGDREYATKQDWFVRGPVTQYQKVEQVI